MFRILRKTFLHLIYLLTIAVLTGLAFLAANGYSFSKAARGDLTPTALFEITSIPDKATIIFDGQKLKEKTPAVLRYIKPGSHTISLFADGFEDWQAMIVADTHLVTRLENVHLLPVEPTLFLQPVTASESLPLSADERNREEEIIGADVKRFLTPYFSNLDEFIFRSYHDQYTLFSRENILYLWDNEKQDYRVWTRLSVPIYGMDWMKDGHNFLMYTKDDVRMCHLKTQVCQAFYGLKSEEVISYLPDDEALVINYIGKPRLLSLPQNRLLRF